MITSAGYDGSVNEPQWSQMLSAAGGRQYGVWDASSWKATIGSGDRQLVISPGGGFGYGITDESDEDVTLTLAAVSSGSRWDLISMRRDWGENESAFTVVQGSATAALPVRETTPAVLDDQPLWLARVQAGSSQVQQLIDLRVWGGDGGAEANDELVLQYLNRRATKVSIGTTLWSRTVDSLGSPVWKPSTPMGPPVMLANEGFGGGGVLAKGGILQVATVASAEAGRALVMGSCTLWLPNGNYGGRILIRINGTQVESRRWHSHNRGNLYLQPYVFTERIVPAGAVVDVMVSLDTTSSGPIELWDGDVHASVSPI